MSYKEYASKEYVQDVLKNVSFEETDPTVPSWAKEPTKPTYTAEEVGALPVDTVIPSIDGLATETYVDNKVADLVNSAPDKLNTLDELAAALGDDENFANTVTASLSNKLDKSELTNAINTALTQAKSSGEFDGAKGDKGETGPQGPKGDTGPAGVDGKDGADGYSPVRGTDYWTATDIAEIKAYIDEAILGGAW